MKTLVAIAIITIMICAVAVGAVAQTDLEELPGNEQDCNYYVYSTVDPAQVVSEERVGYTYSGFLDKIYEVVLVSKLLSRNTGHTKLGAPAVKIWHVVIVRTIMLKDSPAFEAQKPLLKAYCQKLPVKKRYFWQGKWPQGWGRFRRVPLDTPPDRQPMLFTLYQGLREKPVDIRLPGGGWQTIRSDVVGAYSAVWLMIPGGDRCGDLVAETFEDILSVFWYSSLDDLNTYAAPKKGKGNKQLTTWGTLKKEKASR